MNEFDKTEFKEHVENLEWREFIDLYNTVFEDFNHNNHKTVDINTIKVRILKNDLHRRSTKKKV